MVQTSSATDTAKENAKEVASASKEHAGEVVQHAGEKARDLAGEARSQLRAQAESQSGKLAETLSSVASELRKMAGAADDQDGPAAMTAREVGDRADQFAGRLRSEGFDGVVDDVKRFARQRPGVFLLGAVAAGFVAGRVLRNADTGAIVDAAKPSSQDSSPQSQGSLQSQPSPQLAPTSTPARPPTPPTASTPMAPTTSTSTGF